MPTMTTKIAHESGGLVVPRSRRPGAIGVRSTQGRIDVGARGAFDGRGACSVCVLPKNA